mmetsp:Transcript_16328/g.18836  ORF Transcript_16328/g.18836 Transcript_16328/m.18836 type:complete len:118 (-) Transcript_16328:57-410(-)
MTYRARGRSITEVIIAVVLVSFLTGFVFVLCIGNYFRAKRAMERQRHRRLVKLAERNGNGMVSSPRSQSSSEYSEKSAERQTLLLKRTPNQHITFENERSANDTLINNINHNQTMDV